MSFEAFGDFQALLYSSQSYLESHRESILVHVEMTLRSTFSASDCWTALLLCRRLKASPPESLVAPLLSNKESRIRVAALSVLQMWLESTQVPRVHEAGFDSLGRKVFPLLDDPCWRVQVQAIDCYFTNLSRFLPENHQFVRLAFWRLNEMAMESEARVKVKALSLLGTCFACNAGISDQDAIQMWCKMSFHHRALGLKEHDVNRFRVWKSNPSVEEFSGHSGGLWGNGALILALEDEVQEVRLAALDAVLCFGMHRHSFASSALDFLVDSLIDTCNSVRERSLEVINTLVQVWGFEHLPISFSHVNVLLGLLERIDHSARTCLLWNELLRAIDFEEKRQWFSKVVIASLYHLSRIQQSPMEMKFEIIAVLEFLHFIGQNFRGLLLYNLSNFEAIFKEEWEGFIVTAQSWSPRTVTSFFIADTLSSWKASGL